MGGAGDPFRHRCAARQLTKVKRERVRERDRETDRDRQRDRETESERASENEREGERGREIGKPAPQPSRAEEALQTSVSRQVSSPDAAVLHRVPHRLWSPEKRPPEKRSLLSDGKAARKATAG